MGISAEQFREMLNKEKPKRHKYNAKEIVIDGIKFQSTAEGERYCELCWMKMSGDIKEFELQPVFKLHSGIKYIADFKVYYPDGKVEYEDVKGKETPVFRQKLRLLKTDYPDVVLRIIKKKKVRRKK